MGDHFDILPIKGSLISPPSSFL